MQNRHIMFITIEHRNLKIPMFYCYEHYMLMTSSIRKHVTTSCSGMKPFYYFWVKGFDIRRDTIFYAVLFIWPPSRAAPIGRKFALHMWAPKVDPPRLASSTQLSNFLQILINLCMLPVRDITHTLSPPFVSDYCDIWVTPAHAHVNTCLNVAPN